jgi:NAD(P)H-hydrate repair Nnr-like enzyme with NAD(P)H-hydrate epimerase domain
MLNIKYESKNLLPLLDNAAQHYLDQNWIELTGLSMEILVEQAGIAVADTVLKTLVENNVPIDTDTHVLVVGGKGNNGSDAWFVPDI